MIANSVSFGSIIEGIVLNIKTSLKDLDGSVILALSDGWDDEKTVKLYF